MNRKLLLNGLNQLNAALHTVLKGVQLALNDIDKQRGGNEGGCR